MAAIRGRTRGSGGSTADSRRGAWLAWAASLLVVAGLAGAAVAYRTDIMLAWPPSQRVYAVFGAKLP